MPDQPMPRHDEPSINNQETAPNTNWEMPDEQQTSELDKSSEVAVEAPMFEIREQTDRLLSLNRAGAKLLQDVSDILLLNKRKDTGPESTFYSQASRIGLAWRESSGLNEAEWQERQQRLAQKLAEPAVQVMIEKVKAEADERQREYTEKLTVIYKQLMKVQEQMAEELAQIKRNFRGRLHAIGDRKKSLDERVQRLYAAAPNDPGFNKALESSYSEFFATEDQENQIFKQRKMALDQVKTAYQLKIDLLNTQYNQVYYERIAADDAAKNKLVEDLQTA